MHRKWGGGVEGNVLDLNLWGFGLLLNVCQATIVHQCRLAFREKKKEEINKK